MPMERFQKPVLINPNRKWVTSELDKLRDEWVAWQKFVAEIVDYSYDPRTHRDVYADGEGNMRHHDVLQCKTLTFLNTNIRDHGFIVGFDGNGCDRTDLRLPFRVKHRLHALDALRASLQYAQAADFFISDSAGHLTQPGFVHRVGLFAKQHWQAPVKWVFGIAGVIFTAYLLKLVA